MSLFLTNGGASLVLASGGVPRQTAGWDQTFPDGVSYGVTTAGRYSTAVFLPRSIVPSGQGVVFQGLSTQNDVKTSWDDGSVKSVIVSAVFPSTGTYTLRPGTPAAGTFTLSWPSASLVLQETNGTTWTATLPSVTTSDPWLNGPIVRTYRARVRPKNGSDVDHGWLWGIFDVEVWADGGGQVRFTAENADSANVSATELLCDSIVMNLNGSEAYGATSATGANTFSSVYADGAITVTSTDHGLSPGDWFMPTSGANSGTAHWVWTTPTAHTFTTFEYASYLANQSGTSWKKIQRVGWASRPTRRFAFGGHTTAAVTRSFEPEHAMGLLPRIHSTITEPSTYSVTTSRFNFGSAGVYTLPMNGASRHPEIGRLGEHAAQLLVFPSRQDIVTYTVRNAEQACGWGVTYTNSDGTPINFNDGLFYSWQEDNFPSNGAAWKAPINDGAGRYGWFQEDRAHHPQVALVPYLLTGDRLFSELAYFQAQFCAVWPDTVSRNGADLINDYFDVRAGAWTVQAIAVAALLTPDSNTLYQGIMENAVLKNMQHQDTKYAGTGARLYGNNPLGVYYDINRRPDDDADTMVMSEWESNYLSSTLDFILTTLSDVVGTNGLEASNLLVDWTLRLFNSAPDFPWQNTSLYQTYFGTKGGASGPFYPYATMGAFYTPNTITEGDLPTIWDPDGSYAPAGIWQNLRIAEKRGRSMGSVTPTQALALISSTYATAIAHFKANHAQWYWDDLR